MKRLLLPLILLLALTGIVSCGGSSSSDNGTLTLRITDAPADNIEHLWIKFDTVEVKPASGSSVTFDLSDTGAIDLAALTNGNSDTILNSVSLAPGQYNWIRLGVTLVGDGVTPLPEDYAAGSFCYVVADGVPAPLYIPSGDQTGLKLNRPFNVAQGGKVDFVLDFDIRKSLRYDDSKEEWKLKPTIRIMDMLEVGTVHGEITNLAPEEVCSDGAVYVFEGASVTPDDIDQDAVEPLVVVKPYLNDLDNCVYSAAFLETGTYTVAFTWDSADDMPDTSEDLEFFGTVDALVEAKGMTPVNFTLPPF